MGLNTHEWKYRISDPTIGRFWQIDPLAEDYVYNATYAFQENKMGLGIELEGLELHYVNPLNLFNFESGEKPVLTFGLHNIVLPTAERNESGSVGAFTENTAKAVYNGVAESFNAGMQGKNMGDMTSDGMAAMGDTVRRIENGEGTVQDAENMVAAGAMIVVRGKSNKGLGNQFKNKTVKEVGKAMEKNVKKGKMIKSGPDPANGKGAYVNKKSGYSYHLDRGGVYGKKGKLKEGPHIDINYPNPKPKNVPNKKKLPIKEQ